MILLMSLTCWQQAGTPVSSTLITSIRNMMPSTSTPCQVWLTVWLPCTDATTTFSSTQLQPQR